ncbi:Serine protease easter [Pseudolycoriella hygida]|uniref:Serine protease easter n=1 Tax=Pseudolycoriella hygida TaxID=35572 RepID=A0A9Q0MUB5_9DIPT|nr:Serine protease easter [Pseudolycoriella hygida]
MKEGELCSSPNRARGECIKFKKCPSLLKLIQKFPLYDEDLTFLRYSQCGYDKEPLVCCTDRFNRPDNGEPTRRDDSFTVLSSLLPTADMCKVNTGDRIVGGKKAKEDEFPWMALLEYKKPNNRKGFHCGGVLINERYILTAAHCMAAPEMKKLKWILTSVRLGEHDLSTERDCFQGECNDAPVDVAVEKLIPHEKYAPTSKSQENDIALIRLVRPVRFSKYIKPICLPGGSRLKSLVYDDLDLEIAGWGQTENSTVSNVKLKLTIPGVSTAKCNSIYQSRNRVTITNNQLCAGGVLGKDSCRGDSGGPLMYIDHINPEKAYWYCAGIVSFGPTPCGKEESAGYSTACYTPNNQNGICVPLLSCGSLYQLIQKVPLYPEDRNYLRQSQCGYNQQPYVVCCPDVYTNPAVTESSNGLLPSPGVCGTDNTNRIIGGEITKIDEFPWMALIEYSKPNNRRGFHCGGVLISDRYVLTAAHCAVGKDLKQLKWNLASVRLGEWDTNAEEDCDRGDCADPPLDIAVEEVIPHENYNPNSKTQENDIALLRLSQQVTYTDFIKPICLPTADNLKNKNYDGINLDVAGWGKTENVSFSNFKLKVRVPGVSLERCNSVYSRHSVVLGAGQLCAGGIKGADSCRGDSGGPLMTVDTNNPSRPYWYCAGIVSFGPSPCGMEGWPGVYTRVSAYTDWIVRNVRA